MNIAYEVSDYQCKADDCAYLVETVTWLTVSTETACSSSWVRKRSLTKAAMVLQSLTILPTEK